MIEVRNLTKHFAATVAVEDLSFDVSPGMDTGFLGPNGTDKTTTMRTIIGLDRPTSRSRPSGMIFRSMPRTGLVPAARQEPASSRQEPASR
jgi:ABC-2 type transport system ATP-binding protein